MTGASDLNSNYRGVFDGRIGFGARPAVLVIDFIKAYTTPGAPLFAAGVVVAVKETVALLAAARRAHVPIIYTKVLYHPNGMDGGMFVKKVPVLRSMVEGEPLAEIVPELPPAPEDLVLVKNYASSFFGTTLQATLTALGVDTLILTGCSTSGCVRATAIDGVQHGFRVIVPRECVGDRHDAPHVANLFDINAKYGDVVGKTETLQYLAGLTPAAQKRA
ncbi:MAG: isochorismatase family protein [Alphaproteobacteria bacterium]